MFFLSDVDQKKLLNNILPKARSVGVTEELRGWSWHKPPLKPYYDDVKIPMYSACSMYCPTRRDVYLSQVKRLRGKPTPRMNLGSAIHETVRATINSYIEGEHLNFDEWYTGTVQAKGIVEADKDIMSKSRDAYALSHAACLNRFTEAQSRQPYASHRDVMATALPFLVEHRITGEFLGLSGLLRIDCYDYLRNIVFDIKVASSKPDWYRLYATGYALVLESIYEVPVDVGCTIHINFVRDRLTVERDLFFLSDDLRSWWIEERDEKLKLVAQKMDPGFPAKCPEECMYSRECGVDEIPSGNGAARLG